MPAKPSWLLQLPSILEDLRRTPRRPPCPALRPRSQDGGFAFWHPSAARRTPHRVLRNGRPAAEAVRTFPGDSQRLGEISKGGGVLTKSFLLTRRMSAAISILSNTLVEGAKAGYSCRTMGTLYLAKRSLRASAIKSCNVELAPLRA